MKGLKTYFTYLSRNKLFTFVNVIGLSISLMFVLLIGNMVYRQLTVDKDIKDADRIMVFSNETYAGGHYNLGTHLQSRYPEIEDWCALSDNYMPLQLVRDEQKLNINTRLVKKNFFDFFGFPLVQGNAKDVLTDTYSIVLTRSAANRFFGNEPAVGKNVKIYPLIDVSFTITGISEDFDNSIIPNDVEAFLPYELMDRLNSSAAIGNTNMGNAGSAVLFFKTIPGVDLNKKKDDVKSYLRDIFWIFKYGNVKEAHFTPVKEFYFSDRPYVARLNQYSYKKVGIYLIVSIIILLMAVFNYISMNMAQTTYRAKEMATRRLLGSSRRDIFWRLIAESFVLTVISFLLAFLLAKMAEPYAIDLLHTRLNIVGNLSAINILIYLLIVVILSFFSGFIPATILSNYNPLDIVKGTFRRKTKAIYLRLLNIFQSGITIALLASVFYLGVQIYRMVHAPLGYEYGNVLCYDSMGDKNTIKLFRNELQKLPFVKSVSFSQGLPFNGGNSHNMYISSADSIVHLDFRTFVVDSAFLSIYHIRVTENRHLSGDEWENYFVNESTMDLLKKIGRSDAVRDNRDREFNIAGQFKDFQVNSVLDQQKPVRIAVVSPDNMYPWNISVEMKGNDIATYKKEADTLYVQITKSASVNSKWYADHVRDMYKDYSLLQKTLEVFTIAALVISLLGLTAMSIYFISQRKRDISIRKVFGSISIQEQWALMKFTLKSLAYSLVIALPLSIYGIHLINGWLKLENSTPWWVLLIAFAVVIVVSLGSVWLISRKITHENPVNNLKTE